MKVSVWDTYVQRQDGLTMHFDILVSEHQTEESRIFQFGKEYLESKPFKSGKLNARECLFCHIEEASRVVENEILEKGYHIIEMENCN